MFSLQHVSVKPLRCLTANPEHLKGYSEQRSSTQTAAASTAFDAALLFILDATTVEEPDITPKSASCPLSPKSAIFARASPTWWRAVQPERSSSSSSRRCSSRRCREAQGWTRRRSSDSRNCETTSGFIYRMIKVSYLWNQSNRTSKPKIRIQMNVSFAGAECTVATGVTEAATRDDTWTRLFWHNLWFKRSWFTVTDGVPALTNQRSKQPFQRILVVTCLLLRFNLKLWTSNIKLMPF